MHGKKKQYRNRGENNTTPTSSQECVRTVWSCVNLLSLLLTNHSSTAAQLHFSVGVSQSAC